jgi:hypothetical protein
MNADNTSLVADRRREPRVRMADRRREPRMHVNVEVSAVLLSDPDMHFQCQLEEISQSGARLLMSRPVPMDCVIQIEWDTHFLVGSPRYIRHTPIGYVVGIGLSQPI